MFRTLYVSFVVSARADIKGLDWAVIREARAAKHLSQQEAADELGVALRTYQNWETPSGPRPQPRHRRALLAWLDEEQAA